MLKKLLSAFLAFMILTAVSSVNVFARANGDDDKTSVMKPGKKIEKKDLELVSKTNGDSVNSKFTSKDTLAEYEKTKAQGRKFSTATKVLIGVGVAAAVIGIVVFAVNKGAEDAASF